MRLTTFRGSRRSKWTILAAMAMVMAMALGAAAQPDPKAEPPAAPGGAGWQQACPVGMGPMGTGPHGHGQMGPGRCGTGCCGAGHCGAGNWSPGRQARGPRGRAAHRQDFTQHLLHAAEKIGLTDAQKTQLQEIRRRGPATLMPKRQAVMETRMDFQDLMAKKDAPAAEVRKAHDKLLKAQNDLRAARFDLRLQAREVLTPEQRDKLHEKMRGPVPPGGGPGRLGMLDLDDEDEEMAEGESEF